MARNQWEDAISSILQGGLQGFQQGQASNQEMQKMFMLEKIKSAMQRENTISDIKAFELASKKDGISKIKPTLKGGKFSYESLSSEDIGKEESYKRRPQLLSVLGYTREALSKGANPNKIAMITKPERFTTPDEQKLIEKVSSGALGLFQKKQQGLQKQEMTLGKEFIGLKQVKDYTEMRPQISLMEDVYKKIKSGQIQSANAADQAIVNTLGRMIDPGATVREAEYARTPENMSLVNRVDSYVQRVQKGGVLNNNERQEIIRAARIIGNARGKLFNETLKGYQQQAKTMKLRPDIVTRGYKEHAPYGIEEGLTKQGGQIMMDAKGNRAMVYPDGSYEEVQ